MKVVQFVKKKKKYFISVLILIIALIAYFQIIGNKATAKSAFYVINQVERGEVFSGIQATGDIVIAQKLDLDVYKQLSRIDVVNVQNGSHVKKGDILFSFDKNDAYVNMQSARVAVSEAELSLDEAQRNSSDINTEINSLENKISTYEKTIADIDIDLSDAKKDLLNKGLAIMPHPDKFDYLRLKTEPTISGRYISDLEGVYTIEIYRSLSASGFSYSVSGLEYMTDSVIFNKSLDLGQRGLKITFPNDIRAGDKWIVLVPDREAALYTELLKNYEENIDQIKRASREAEIALLASQQQLAHLISTDSSSYRDLKVERSRSSLAESQQRLSKNYDVLKDRDIIAPFSGTVEGLENVVVGATPTGGSADSISLGMLLADEFLTTFNLNASDIAKVKTGDRVKVTITSLIEQPIFEAIITQISSLPSSGGVAQYKVEALLDYDKNKSEIILREGMLADIEVIQQENKNALRIPTSAVKYQRGVAKVTLVDELTSEQKNEVARLGIIRRNELDLPTYEIEVELGIIGQYFIEVISGLKEGDLIIGSSLATDDSAENYLRTPHFNGSGPNLPQGNFNSNQMNRQFGRPNFNR